VLIRGGAVYLRKRCPAHGWHEALVISDADWYLNSLKYNKPGSVPHRFATAVDKGCPSDCGLCPEHQQHTCLGIIEVTTRCNLSCPTCFADSGDGFDLTLGQVEAMVDRLIQSEGQPEVVQVSGGEPSLHPQILHILGAIKQRGVRHVMLNTNGLRLAEDSDFVKDLAGIKPLVYLQFDGLGVESHERLRGRDLRDVKRKALDRLADAGLKTVLVATLVKGINEGEIGEILRFGLEHPAVLGVSYQPATFTGRCMEGRDPMDRITLTDVLHRLEEQTEGSFQVSDFRPVPCPYPTCSACTYAFIDGEKVLPITRLLDVDEYLDFVTNRVAPDLSAELQPILEELWSMGAVMGSEVTTGNLNCIACDCGVSISPDAPDLRRHFFMVQVHGFMDVHSFDVKRLMKCCIHQLLPDGRAMPFCSYNNLGHREQVKLMLGGGK
jgi:uncharacterized radical SAM superfamily Fe-S cluster-containing enzyme